MLSCFQSNSSLAEDRYKNDTLLPMSQCDIDQVAMYEGMIAMELMLNEGLYDVLVVRREIDLILSKYHIPSMSVLNSLVLPKHFRSIAPQLAVASKIMTDEMSEDSCETSEEENLAIRDPSAFACSLSRLLENYQFKVKYMGTIFEFPTMTEAQKFATDRNMVIDSFGPSEKLLGGVRQRPKRRGKPNRTKARKRNVQDPTPQARQEGQINAFIPRPRDAITPIKFNGALIADGSGVVSARFNVLNPLRAFNGSGTYVNALDFGGTYDRYKVKSFIFQYMASSPVQAGVIVTAFDWDAPDLLTPNYANTLNYANYKQFTASRNFIEMARPDRKSVV